jgi:hypothetical protein
VPAEGGEVIELASNLMAEDPSLADEVQLAIVSADEYVSRFQARLRARDIEKPQSDLPWIALVNGLEDRGRLREPAGPMCCRASRSWSASSGSCWVSGASSRLRSSSEPPAWSRALPARSARCDGEIIEVAVLGQQLSKPSAGVEHPRFDRVLGYPDDLGDLLDGLVVIVDEIDDLAVVG